MNMDRLLQSVKKHEGYRKQGVLRYLGQKDRGRRAFMRRRLLGGR